MKNYVKSILLAALAGSVIHAGPVVSRVKAVVKRNPRVAAVVVATGIGAAGFALGRKRAATLDAQLKIAQQEIAQLAENSISFRYARNSNEAGASNEGAPCAYVNYALYPATETGAGQICLVGASSRNLYAVRHFLTADGTCVITVTHVLADVLNARLCKERVFTLSQDILSDANFGQKMDLPFTVAEALKQLALQIAQKEGLWE